MTDLAQVPTEIAELADRAAITDLVSRLGVYLDEQRIDDLGDLFTTDVIGQFPGGDEFQGLELLQAHAGANLPKWELKQHVITNVITELDGDEAEMRANLIATHVHVASKPASHWEIGATYDFAARRTDSGWLLTKVILKMVWTGGDESPA